MPRDLLCLETYWSPNPADRRTMRGLLEVLEANENDFVAHHRHVDSRRDIQRYLDEVWNSARRRYDILVIATHGDRGVILDEDDREIPLRWLGRQLKDICSDAVVYFAGCSTLDAHDSTLERFLDMTGADAVVGYRRPVNWVEAAQMDFVSLGALVRGMDRHGKWRTPPKEILSKVKQEHEGFAKRLQWDFVPHE